MELYGTSFITIITQFVLDHYYAGLPEKYLETISVPKNYAISLHLQTAPNNPAATTLALTTILRRKGRLLQFFTTSRQILRQQLDPQGLQWLDELNNIYSELSTCLLYTSDAADE